MCAQAVEKSLKAYVLLNGAVPAKTHRPDKYLETLLGKDNPLLRHKGHYKHLSALFNADTKARVKELLDLTPGGLGNRDDVPNTEYPWVTAGESRSPVGMTYPGFGDTTSLRRWLDTAKRVSANLYKLWISVDRAGMA